MFYNHIVVNCCKWSALCNVRCFIQLAKDCSRSSNQWEGIWFRQTGLRQFFFARPSKAFWYLAKVRSTNASAQWVQCNDGSDAFLTSCPHCQIGYSCRRQCQIRIRFESRGRPFVKALEKWFLMTKYAPIIIIWCIERGFFKKSPDHLF